MIKYDNLIYVKGSFKNLLKDKQAYNDILITEEEFNLGVDYYFQELKDFNKPSVIGLTIDETFLIRQFLGFNVEMTAYNYEEIKKNWGITRPRTSIINSLSMIRGVIKNIKKVLEKQIEYENPVLKTLLGDTNLPKRIFNPLRYHGICTIGDLVNLTISDIKNFKNIGPSGIIEIEKLLLEYDLKLKDEEVFETDNSKYEISEEEKQELNNRKLDLELKILAIKYKKVLLQCERFNKEKAEIEKRMQDILVEKTLSVDLTKKLK